MYNHWLPVRAGGLSSKGGLAQSSRTQHFFPHNFPGAFASQFCQLFPKFWAVQVKIPGLNRTRSISRRAAASSKK